jgi:hypothetical protein
MGDAQAQIQTANQPVSFWKLRNRTNTIHIPNHSTSEMQGKWHKEYQQRTSVSAAKASVASLPAIKLFRGTTVPAQLDAC